MIKKLFQATIVPALVTAVFSVMLSLSHVSGDIFLDEWIHRGVLIFLELLVWLSGGWLFNRMLSVLFWDAIVGMYTEHHPPKMLVQISGIFVFSVFCFTTSLGFKIFF